MPLTAIVLTKNEEKQIEQCLQSLSWCDEILVIDDHSHDDTVSIAKRHGATVYVHAVQGNFSAQRNYGLSKAKHEWVLFVDADEIVSDTLHEEIRWVITHPFKNYEGFYIPRVDVIWGKTLRYGETGHAQFLRVAKKDAGKWEGSIHEVWMVKGETSVLKNPLFHYPHQTMTIFLEDVNTYTDIRAQELFRQRKKSNLIILLLYPGGKFFWNYFIKAGFLDGSAGVVMAIMMSFHSFLVRAKLWTLTHRNSHAK